MSLPKFEGKPVTEATIRITKAGDGLSAALDLEPVALHQGDVVYYVIRGVVEQVNHRPTKAGAKSLARQHTIAVSGITTLPKDVAEPMIAEAEERIQEMLAEAEREEERKREAEKGVEPLSDEMKDK